MTNSRARHYYRHNASTDVEIWIDPSNTRQRLVVRVKSPGSAYYRYPVLPKRKTAWLSFAEFIAQKRPGLAGNRQAALKAYRSYLRRAKRIKKIRTAIFNDLGKFLAGIRHFFTPRYRNRR